MGMYRPFLRHSRTHLDRQHFIGILDILIIGIFIIVTIMAFNIVIIVIIIIPIITVIIAPSQLPPQHK